MRMAEAKIITAWSSGRVNRQSLSRSSSGLSIRMKSQTSSFETGHALLFGVLIVLDIGRQDRRSVGRLRTVMLIVFEELRSEAGSALDACGDLIYIDLPLIAGSRLYTGQLG